MAVYPRQDVRRGGEKRRTYSRIGRNGDSHSPFLVIKSLLISTVNAEGDNFALVWMLAVEYLR